MKVKIMNEFIDIYCERVGAGLWAEPLNALSNAAFFIAALAAFVYARRHMHAGGKADWRVLLLVFLLVLIGAGSSLFHVFATFWAMWADMIPIMLFQIAYIALYARGVIGLGIAGTSALLGGFFALTIIAAMLPHHWLNGSIGYLPALIYIAGLGIYHLRTATRERWILLIAADVFIVSLVLRSVDMIVCEFLPIGVHYMWHILNSIVLYLTVRGFISGRENNVVLHR
jgi:hypothetical protein